jgi:NitT/TauT family transport system substrate-binding protein
MTIMQCRRRFVTNAAVASAAGFGALGAISRGGARESLAAEPAPEISTIRLSKFPGICIAPQYIVGDLLRAEGFTEIRYVPLPAAFSA